MPASQDDGRHDQSRPRRAGRGKQTEEACVALAKGVELAEKRLPKLDSGDLGYGWLDWLIGHILMREAQALIQGQADPPSIQSNAK
jgi:hypothetical protein